MSQRDPNDPGDVPDRPKYTQTEYEHARENVAENPRNPRVKALRVLRHFDGLPFSTGDILVLGFDIEEGKPGHGEMRSDDHISGLQLKAPVAELTGEDGPDECPVCGHETAEYSYDAYHHIAGGFSITCAFCEETINQDEWS